VVKITGASARARRNASKIWPSPRSMSPKITDGDG
jgi:hypothetical protein